MSQVGARQPIACTSGSHQWVAAAVVPACDDGALRTPASAANTPGAWPILTRRTDVAQPTKPRAPRRPANPTPEQTWAWNLWRNYRLRPDEYYRLMREQDGRCAICGIPDEEAPDLGAGRPRRSGVGTTVVIHRLVVDHCHRTNTVRGLLCVTCNTGLGSFRDNTAKLEGAIAYLRKHRAQPLPEATRRPADARRRSPAPSGQEPIYDGLW